MPATKPFSGYVNLASIARETPPVEPWKLAGNGGSDIPPDEPDDPPSWNDDDDEEESRPLLRPWVRQILDDLELLVAHADAISLAQLIIGSISWPVERDPHVAMEQMPFGQIQISFTDPGATSAERKRVDMFFSNTTPQLQFCRWRRDVKGDTLGVCANHTVIGQRLIDWLFSSLAPNDILI